MRLRNIFLHFIGSTVESWIIQDKAYYSEKNDNEIGLSLFKIGLRLRKNSRKLYV